MMEDSGIELLLTQAQVRGRLALPPGLTVLALDIFDVGDEAESNPNVILHGENLAYVIYTSGSTGQPKGAANRHSALYNRLVWMQDAYALAPGDTVLQKTPFSFDVSVWEFFWPLMTGARLVLARPGDHRDPERLVALIRRHAVTTIHFVPSMLQAFIAHDTVESCTSLRRIVCSGEALPAELQNQVLQRLPWAGLYNLYGPTEAAIDVTHWTCARDGAASVPIGRPIANVRTHVLDADLNAVPPGVAGELYLGGEALARGYLNRAGLTAERFVPDPFDPHGGRLYRTGDLVRLRADGVLDYLGRVDHQIKIRGFRIELGEIEARLQAQPDVRAAVVVAQTGSNGARLVAYVSPAAGRRIDTAALRAALGEALPDYMVPAAIVVLETLPLNPNGKVDRKALPAPEVMNTECYEAPQNDVEKMLASVWAEVLGVEPVGRQDNFFELGGDSILSLQIVARLRQAGWKVTPRQLFERQTVAQLAAVAQAIDVPVRANRDTTGAELPLLPFQAEFFRTDIPVRQHWNQALLLQSREPLALAPLRQAFAALVQQHDALRLRYRQDGAGHWRQICTPVADRDVQEWLWVRRANDAPEIDALCEAAQRSLDLAQGPLLRALVIEVADGSWRLLLVIHHLVVDGVSWRILLDDLYTAYAQAQAGNPITLAAKSSSLQTWAQRLRRYGDEHPDELVWWQDLAQVPAALPCDDPSGANSARHRATVRLTLDRATTQALLKDAPAAYRTQVNDILLTALGRALCEWSGQQRILVELEGHGREDIYDDIDLSRTVGWFTTLFPVALEPLGTPGEALKRVKEHLRRVPRKGLGYGVLTHFGTPEQRDALAALPKAQIVFNYLGQFDSAFHDSAAWTPAREPAGALCHEDAPLQNEFSVNGQVYDGELTLTATFSEARHRREAVAAWMAAFQRELESLIAHCTGGAAGATPADFPLAGVTQSQLDALPVPIARIEDMYPLSPMQAGMLFHSIYDTRGNAYVTQLRADLGGLDAERFRRAWQAALDRHSVLRTGFLNQGDAPLQWVARTAALALIEHDWRARADRPAGLAAELDALARDQQQGFDLMQPPLMRLALVRTGEHEHHFIWTCHHLLLDGWSVSQLFGDVLREYAGKRVSDTHTRYRDYIAWLQARDSRASEAWWRETLRRMDEPTRLVPLLAPPAAAGGYGEHLHAFDPALADQINDAARRERVTLNTLIQAAWALLLQRYTGQGCVVFGMTTAGRPDDLPGAERMLGLFINTVPMIAAPEPQRGVGEWLRVLQADALAAREHEATPLYQIQRWAGNSGQALFDTLLVFENYPIDAALRASTPGGLRISRLAHLDDTHYPLTVNVLPGETLRLQYRHACEHLDDAVVARLAGHMATLLRQLAAYPERRLGTIDLVDDTERALVMRWGCNRQRYPAHAPVQRLIEAQAATRPDATALIAEDTVLSYAELNRRANRLAHRLIALGVGPEVRVGVALERSVDMVVGLLAILKAGGAYVPLDPEYPAERLRDMMADSGIAWLLTHRCVEARLPRPDDVCVLALDTLALAREPDANPGVVLHEDAVAYVIYTSGSTGKPKGIGIPHHALAEHSQVAIAYFGLTPADRMLQFSTINFDAFIEQLFPPLCAGAAVVLRGPALWDSDTWYREVLDKRITIADLPTAYWFMLAQDFARHGPRDYGALRQVQATGEAMPPEGVKAWRDAGLAHVKLLNTYGPTETTVTATAFDCGYEATGGRTAAHMPIGTPLAGRDIYILDAGLNLVPPGVAGELYIGGTLLARGYHRRPGLTAERFVADPFAANGARLYRTGDLARWNTAGQLEYLGRIDHQVKIRGFRIELGEVEARLLEQSAVREAVVMAQAHAGGSRLVAYVAGGAEARPDAAALRASLGRALPDYMLPAAIVVLDELPKTPNGKLDRQALPPPDTMDAARYEAPEDGIETALAAIWAEVLGIGRVGRHDNFFDLGGDSILSLQIVARLRRAGWTVSPKDVFERQTVAKLAEAAQPAEMATVGTHSSVRGTLHDYLDPDAIAALALDERDIEDVYPLVPLQEGMLFHSLEAPGSGLYVNQLSVELRGLDAERYAHAWRAMVERHAVLRTGFLWQAGLARPLQFVRRRVDVPVQHLDWRGLDRPEQRLAAYAQEELTRPFDFLAPPLSRLSLIRLDDDRHRLVWTQHHILLDGWSDSRLIGDWLRYYGGESLAAPGPGYGDYVRWLGERDAQASETFWKAELADLDGPTLLAPAVATPASGRDGYAKIYTRLDKSQTRTLSAAAQRERVTLNTLIQAAWALLLQRYTGKDRVVFGATVAGRPQGLPGVEDMLGLFINTIPVPVSRHAALTVGDYLRALQATNLRLREHEHSPLADIQRWAGMPGRPLFDSLIVFENYPIDAALRGSERHGLQICDVANEGLTGYAMDLQVVAGETLEIEYCYARRDFADDTVHRLRRCMEHLLQELARHPQRAVGEIDGLAPDERAVLSAWERPATFSSGGRNSYVHRTIEHHARLSPHAIALRMGERSMSYAELNAHANRLAHRLIALGVRPERRVGVAMERSLDVIVALLAVLKAGGAYVPLDPAYPADRLAFMTEDSGLSLLLTQSTVLPALRFPPGVQALALDTVELDAGSDTNPDVPLAEQNLAYIIYTSGSTGTPKGVAVTHGPLAMHCRATAEIYGMTPDWCELLFMSFSFDGAHERWLTALTSGASLAIRDNELWTAEQTYEALHRYRIANAAFPPAYLGQLADWAASRSDPPPVELYVFGGEAMPKAAYEQVRRTLRPRQLINGYGPTETVVTPLIWKVAASESFECAYAPIGKPVGERAAYVLDADLQPVPVGVVGELYLGGYGLARGYLGRAGLTAERFVADPFDRVGGRLYRTGDLVRWRDDGNVEYIGRADHQVKIRGFRIELGEIEARVREIDGVADAAVIAHENASGRQLVAYVVPAGSDTSSFLNRLKQALSDRLPEYMVPTHILTLPRLPRLPSGKLDRNALPPPGAVERAYVPPSTHEAKLLAQIWQEVLHVECVGETDNFFELGGDSLLSLKVLARLRQLRDPRLDFKLRDLMQRPTIAGLLGLETQARAPIHAPLALNKIGDHPKPLFCVHAGMGTVFDYQPLARRLHGRRTVYAIPCRMLADPAHCDLSLEQMAADYCRMIRQIQPQGPYHLLGWSLGGALAAMIAGLLEADGASVAFLGLVDSFIPGIDEPADAGRDDWQTDFTDILSVVIPDVKATDALAAAALRSTPSDDALTALLEHLLSRHRARAGANAVADGYAAMGAEDLARIFTVSRRLKEVSRKAPGLPAVRAPSYCWWITERALADRSELARQLGRARRSDVDIATDHFSVMRSDIFLQGVESALAGSAKGSVESRPAERVSA